MTQPQNLGYHTNLECANKVQKRTIRGFICQKHLVHSSIMSNHGGAKAQ
jgi:hypothetical protein